MAKLIVLLTVLSVVFCHSVEDQIILTVSPTCSQTIGSCDVAVSPGTDCLELDFALDCLRNRTSLILEPGTHTIRQPQLYYNYYQLTSLLDINITGAGVDETIVTCDEGHGLVFLGVTNLHLAGITIQNCGLANDQLINPFYYLAIDKFFHIKFENSKIAMLLASCANVVMEDIHITNTTGMGLLGINAFDSTLNRVNFTRNIRLLCLDETQPDLNNSLYFDQIGGGANFLYFDTYESSGRESAYLAVQDSYFAHNADCTSSAITSVNVGFDVTSFIRYYYSYGAGGGLSVIIANRDIVVSAFIHNCIFYQNDARHGAGAYVASFADVQSETSVIFSSCTFLENGVATSDGIQETHCLGGGGLAIFNGLSKPLNFDGAITSIQSSIIVHVMESNFTQNRAEVQGGGVMAYSLFYTLPSTPSSFVAWYLSGARFERNSAMFSSAIHVTESASANLTILILQNINVLDSNYQLNEDLQSVSEDNAAVLIADVTRCRFNDMLNFRNNIGSALRIENTLCALELSSVTFQQNLAHRGGAIYFSGESSSIRLDAGSRLNFVENQAVTEGGALYVAPLSTRLAILRPEILHPEEFFDATSDCFITGHFSLNFVGNRAPLGSIFFGPSQESCPWAADHLGVQNQFNSLPASITAALRNNTPDQPPLSLVPGQTVGVEINVSDAYNQMIPALVSSVIGFDNTQATSTLGNSGFWHTSVTGSQLTVTSANYSGPLRISIISEQNSISTSFSVELDPCPIGFSTDKSSPRCKCHDTLVNSSGIECLDEMVSFLTSRNTWIGVNPAVSDPSTNDLIMHRCPLNYCKALGNNNTVLPPDFESQCNFNRSGFLCGDCEKEYSHVFGTNECHKCNNFWLFLVPTFAIAGALLFSGLALLEITIDKGLTNVIIFFGSIASQFDFLSPSDTNYSPYFLPFRLLALQLGISTCFYDGMTTLERSALLFVFPIYLYILMGIFTLLCRRFTWMSIHFSPAKTLATLTVMCYLSILNTTLDILIFVRVESIGGNVSYRWFLDPTFKYFSGGHAALAVISILVISLYIIPAPIFFLFPSLAYKYLKKYIPFWDILWAAYKPKFRFWLGIRVFLILASYPTTRIPLYYAYLVNSSIGLAFLVIEASIQPFKDRWANYADLALLTCLNMYLRRTQLLTVGQQRVSDMEIELVSTIYLAVIILIIYVIYILLFGWHFHRQFPSLGAKIRQIATKRSKKNSKPTIDSTLNDDGTSLVPSTTTTVEIDVYKPPPVARRAPQPAQAAKFRDSIFEDMHEDS